MAPPDEAAALKPMFWDTVPSRVSRLWLGTAVSTMEFRRRRLRERIAATERLLRSGDFPGAMSVEELDAIGKELRDRRERWKRLLDISEHATIPAAPRDSPVTDALRSSVRHAPTELVLGLFLLPLAFFLQWAIAAILGLLLAIAVVRRPNVRALATQALTSDECPGCGYPLAELGPGAGLEERLRCRLGPDRCPECGCAWPLLPASMDTGRESVRQHTGPPRTIVWPSGERSTGE
jgi:hypothetical protein